MAYKRVGVAKKAWDYASPGVQRREVYAVLWCPEAYGHDISDVAEPMLRR